MNAKNMKKLVGLTALFTLIVFAAGCSDDDSPVAPNMGSGAKLRVVHASPDAGAVDIYVAGVDAPVVSGLDYAQATPYLNLDPGSYNFQIRPAGAPASSSPVYETGDLALGEGTVVTALAAGLISASDAAAAFRVLPLQEAAQDPGAGNASVRIVHASPDAPAVAIDVGNDGSPEITSLDRFADTGAAGVPLPAGVSLAVGIWTASPLTKVTSFTTPELPEGADLLLIAIGRVADLPRDETGFGLLAVGSDGVVGLIRQDPSVFLLHASPDAPPVDVLAGGTSAVLVGNLSFGDLSPAVQLPPATYELDVAPQGGGAVVASVSTPALQAGERYLAIATGFVSGTPSFTVLPLREGFASSSSALLRVVHASPDAPAVDVGVWDGTNFTALAPLSNLAFGEASDEAGVAVPAGSLSAGIAATGKTTPVAVFDLAPTAGMRTFAVACGSLNGTGESFRLVMVDASSYPWQAVSVNPN